ncbi:hypothetical protein [Parasphingorhabdus sp.]|uniref:hypothetical protein n=1 Tax=Parasphingorhabdus sp. TaxID=2709688 RepID=UPI003A939E7F
MIDEQANCRFFQRNMVSAFADIRFNHRRQETPLVGANKTGYQDHMSRMKNKRPTRHWIERVME